MAISKRHFEALARIAGRIADPETRSSVTDDLVAFCYRKNPRFDGARFRDAVLRAHNVEHALTAAKITTRRVAR
jgi:hypothetical protein